MTSILYFHPQSSNARKVVMLDRHLDWGAELRCVDLFRGEQRSPEYLAIDPNGKVPVLVDGEFILSESRAILEYMARSKERHDLVGRSVQGAARVHQWLYWSASKFAPLISRLSFERTLKRALGLGEPDERVIEHTLRELVAAASILDARLDGRDFVSGDVMTIADISLAMEATNTPLSKFGFSEWPHISAWLERMKGQPGWLEHSADA